MTQDKWYVYRNGGIDVDGEWQPSDSWSATKTILPGVVHRVDIVGTYRENRFGLVARRWFGQLDIRGWKYGIKSSHPSCKSVRDALRYADRDLTDEVVYSKLRHFYRTKERATCIVRIDKNGNQTPFLSWLGSNVDWMSLDMGHYIAAHIHPWYETNPDKIRVFASRVERFWHGYAGRGCSDEIDNPPSWAWSNE